MYNSTITTGQNRSIAHYKVSTSTQNSQTTANDSPAGFFWGRVLRNGYDYISDGIRNYWNPPNPKQQANAITEKRDIASVKNIYPQVEKLIYQASRNSNSTQQYLTELNQLAEAEQNKKYFSVDFHFSPKAETVRATQVKKLKAKLPQIKNPKVRNSIIEQIPILKQSVLNDENQDAIEKSRYSPQEKRALTTGKEWRISAKSWVDHPDVAVSKNKVIAFVWSALGPPNNAVKLVCYNEDGTPIIPITALSNITQATVVRFASTTIAPLPDGSFVAGWENTQGISRVHISSDCQTIGPELQTSSSTTGIHSNPVIAVPPEETPVYLFIWEHKNDTSTNSELKGRTFDQLDDTPASPEFPITQDSSKNYLLPSAVFYNPTEFVVVAQNQKLWVAPIDVEMLKRSINGTLIENKKINGQPEDYAEPHVVYDTDKNEGFTVLAHRGFEGIYFSNITDWAPTPMEPIYRGGNKTDHTQPVALYIPNSNNALIFFQTIPRGSTKQRALLARMRGPSGSLGPVMQLNEFGTELGQDTVIRVAKLNNHTLIATWTMDIDSVNGTAIKALKITLPSETEKAVVINRPLIMTGDKTTVSVNDLFDTENYDTFFITGGNVNMTWADTQQPVSAIKIVCDSQVPTCTPDTQRNIHIKTNATQSDHYFEYSRCKDNVCLPPEKHSLDIIFSSEGKSDWMKWALIVGIPGTAGLAVLVAIVLVVKHQHDNKEQNQTTRDTKNRQQGFFSRNRFPTEPLTTLDSTQSKQATKRR